MAEWGIPFHVIEREWTEQQFQLMARMLMQRRRDEKKAAKTGGGQPQPYQ